MSERAWKPSARALELIAAMWRAFEQGDKWVRVEHPSTVRYTGQSLVWNGIAEQDGKRFRLSESCLNANGMTRVVRMFAGVTYGEVIDIQEAIEAKGA